MALTKDEIREILELYGNGYSGRKIADKTEHSEVTIYKLIRLAKKRVINLQEEGLEAEQIASRLECPLACVRSALENYEEKQRERLEAGVEPEVEVEIHKSLKKSEIRTDWDKFQKGLQIEQCKDKIRSEAIELIDFLKFWEEDFRKGGVYNQDYHIRQMAIRKELEDFVLTKIDESDSREALSDLESILEGISETIIALIQEYDEKTIELRQARKAEEQKRSAEYLNSNIIVPLFPAFVKEEINKRFPVKNFKEASIVSDALIKIALKILKRSDFTWERNDEMWQPFMNMIKDGGWDYLNKMALECRTDT